MLSVAVPAVLAAPSAHAFAPAKVFPEYCAGSLVGGIDPTGGGFPTGLVPTLTAGSYSNVGNVVTGQNTIVSDLSNTTNNAKRFSATIKIDRAPAATTANGGTQPTDASGSVAVLWKNGPGTTPANTGVGLPTLSVSEHAALFGTPPTKFFAKGPAQGVPGPIWQADPLVSPPNSPLKNVITDFDTGIQAQDGVLNFPIEVLNPTWPGGPTAHLHGFGGSFVMGNANQVPTQQSVFEIWPAAFTNNLDPNFVSFVNAVTGGSSNSAVPCSLPGMVFFACEANPALLGGLQAICPAPGA